MTITKYTTGYSNLTAARELEILEKVLPNGILYGMAPFVSNPDDFSAWTVSLYSGAYCIDGTIIEDDSTYTSLWDLSTLSPGTGTKYFLFYAEYKYSKTSPIGPNYRFVYGSTPRTLADRGNSSYDPWYTDTGHENSTAIPLAILIIPNGATSIDHSSVWMIRARTISSSTSIEQKASRYFNLDYDVLGARKDSGNLELAWRNMRVVGYSPQMDYDVLSTSHGFDFEITGPDTPVSFSAPQSLTYTQCLTMDLGQLEQVRAVAIVVKPSWNDPDESLEASFIPLFPGEDDDYALVNGSTTNYTGDDELPYRDDLKNYIVVGYVLHNSDVDLFKVSMVDGFVAVLSGNSDAYEEAHSFVGVSTNAVTSLKSTVYGTQEYSNVSGVIDIDDIIDNIASLQSITLDDAYNDTAAGGSSGDGRVITADYGAVKIINEPGTSGTPGDKWLAPFNVVYSGDYSDFQYSERGIDIAQTEIDPNYTDGYLANSTKPALTFRIPFEFYNGSFYISKTISVTIKESSVSAGVPVIDNANLAEAVEYANARGIEVYATFTLTNPAHNGNKNYYKMVGDTVNDEVILYLYDESSTAPLSHFGGLVSPITSQSLHSWIIKASIGGHTRLHDLIVNNEILTRSITGFNPLHVSGEPVDIHQTSDATNTDTYTYTKSGFKTVDVPTAGFGGKHAFSIEGDSVDEVELAFVRVSWGSGSAPNQAGIMSFGLNDGSGDSDMFAMISSGNSTYCIVDRDGDAHLDRINSNLYLSAFHVLGKASVSTMGDTTDAIVAISNTEHSNSSGGRLAGFKFGGEKADGTHMVQGAMLVSHSTSSNDFNSQIALQVNDNTGAASLQDVVVLESDSGEDQGVLRVQKISTIDTLAPIDVSAMVRLPTPYPLDIGGIIYARTSVNTNRINGMGSTQLVFSNTSSRFQNRVYFDSQISGPASTLLLDIAGQAKADSHIVAKNTPIAWASLDWDGVNKEFEWGGSFGFEDDSDLVVYPSNGIYRMDFDESLVGIVSAYDLAVFIQIIQDIGPARATLIEFNHSYVITPTGVEFRIQFKNGGTWYDIDETSPAVGSGFEGVSIVVVGQT